MLDKAFQAQDRLAQFSQDRIDSVVQHMAEAGLGAAEKLARMAVEETGYGNVADKVLKNKFGAEFVYQAIKDLNTVGILREDREKGILEIASPVGVIAAIIPSTNPTSTTINKALIALKGCNAIVFSPHPSAAGCIQETSRILSEAAVAAGAPEGAIGCLSQSTIEGTRELMSHRKTALILATGWQGLVKAAYSVGKPAFGVGPGNVLAQTGIDDVEAIAMTDDAAAPATVPIGALSLRAVGRGRQGVGQPAPVHEVGADRVAPVRGPGQPRVPVRAVPRVVLEEGLQVRLAALENIPQVKSERAARGQEDDDEHVAER